MISKIIRTKPEVLYGIGYTFGLLKSTVIKYRIMVLLFLVIVALKNSASAKNDLLADQCKEDSVLGDINCDAEVLLAMVDTPAVVDTPSFSMPLETISTTDTNYIPPERFKTRLPKALVVPGILITWGLINIGSHGLYSSHQARSDLLGLTKGKGGPIDDYLIVSPYFEFAALLLLKVKCRNDFVNTTLLIAKSELLTIALVTSLKYITHEERPYSYQKDLNGVPLDERKNDRQAFLSMPSGHAAVAFVAATIVYREYRYLSPWYGVGAYALASTVGIFRMVNDKHWESDVFIGAGIGILSANIVYATHQHRWGRNNICFVPTFGKDSKGLSLCYGF